MPLILGANATNPTVEFHKWGYAEYEKGWEYTGPAHANDGDEFMFIIQGKCIVEDDGQQFTLETGDVFAFRMGKYHRLIKALEDLSYLGLSTRLRGQKRSDNIYEQTD